MAHVPEQRELPGNLTQLSAAHLSCSHLFLTTGNPLPPVLGSWIVNPVCEFDWFLRVNTVPGVVHGMFLDELGIQIRGLGERYALSVKEHHPVH